MHLLYEYGVMEPSAIVSMGIVWTWLLAFVLADWRLDGTPGQLMLGLRLKRVDGGGRHLGIITCVARNCLAVLAPIVITGDLLLIPIAYSQTEKVLRLTAGYAVLAIVPLSIAFTGGHTLPDLLLRVRVLPKRSGPTQYPVWLDKKRWLLLILTSVTTGLIFSLALNLESNLAWKQAAPPLTVVSMNDPTASAWMWTRLQQRVPAPSFFIQHVEVFHVTGSLSADTYDALDSTLCTGSRRALGKNFLVDAQVRILTPTPVKSLLYANLQDIADSQAPANKRPAFLLFNLTTREDFGVFTLIKVEGSALCLAQANGKPQDRFVITGDADDVTGGTSLLSLLALGRLGLYSYVQRLPIWSHRD